MKEGWRYEKLDDLGTIVTGATPSTNDESNYFPKEYCFVKPSDLPINGVGSIHETENYVSSKGLSVSRPLPAGSVLTTCIGTIGKVGLLLQEGCTNQQINAVIPNNKINSRYLAYALLSIRKQLEFIANAPVVPIINKKCFSKIHIGYPPKPSQLSIVSELDKLNELIQIKKEQLKDYDALAQSIFYEMFGDPVEEGWDVKELGDICKTSSGGTPSKAHTEYYNGEIMWLRSGEVSQGDIYNTEQTITLLGLENSSAKIFPVNTVVIAMYGATVGQVGILRKEMSTNQAICGIFPNEDLTPEYLYYFLISKKAEFLKSAIGGAQANISQQIIRKTLIPLPPLSLQSSFTCKIRQIKLQKAAVQSTITDLETLLAARMQYWFD
ncbi:restriction endonuclease subunit S [Prevotella melaninogenica]|jgi:type I restriction-modification system, S subunit|uniref:restriction endonuclease subunit S n=1 Tax=Prevotella melaninogenica TaxID=28132 RepID=UPI001C5CCA1D|nr:restriction endonuclease subunit S [Prevotella melaninogenica]MBW4731338.1 restriction endonuclease subunit S [Prevotella melaninogenica]MBW4750361.1 restriction endonuclease subunit S [Prevotella melaninogenica]